MKTPREIHTVKFDPVQGEVNRVLQLVCNFETRRWGWFNALTGEVEAWYPDQESAFAAHNIKLKRPITKL